MIVLEFLTAILYIIIVLVVIVLVIVLAIPVALLFGIFSLIKRVFRINGGS